MKILLTGARGFIGRNLAEHLAQGHDLLTPTRDELDLLDEASVDGFFKKHPVDAVIHAAGKPGHRNASDPTGVFYADTRMYFSLMRNRDHFGRLLITGSGGVYDLRHLTPQVKEEQWKMRLPADEHGFFRHVTAHHIEVSSGVVDLRLFGVFGKYEDYAIRFISNAICKTLFELPITIRQNRSFDYLYIEDLFPVVDHFLTCDCRYREYNVTPGRPVTLESLARRVLRAAGKELPVLIAQQGMGLEYSGSNSRLLQEMPGLGFTDPDVAIARLYEWYRNNIGLIDKNALLVDK